MLLMLFPLVSGAQKLEGRWAGDAKIGETSLRIVLEMNEDGQSAKVQSPDQSAQWFDTSSLVFKDRVLTFEVGAWRFKYQGTLGDDMVFRGSFTQNGTAFPLDFAYVIREMKPAPQQNVERRWTGKIDVGIIPQRINLEVYEGGQGGRMQFPYQSEKWIEAASLAYNDGELTFGTSNEFKYKGTLGEDGVIRGLLAQTGTTFSLDFTNVKGEWEAALRPQEPTDFPYVVEEVVFRNGDIALAGTLTQPEGSGPFPAVVLVTGSGAQDRNEELMGHKPFLVLSDYLTRRGIAVLRYDDRGTHGSGGDYMASDVHDFATDAAAAIEYLRSRGMERVGIAGHSEGGMVAMLLAAEGKPDFIVSMAGPGVDGRTLMGSQRSALLGAMGMSEEVIEQSRIQYTATMEIICGTDDQEEMAARLKELYAGTPAEGFEKQIIAQVASPSIRSIFLYDPAKYYPRIVCPVLAVNGEKDLQVIAAPNLEGIRLGLAHNPDVTLKSYPNLNHLFQTAKTGLLDEYASIEETFNEEVMRDIADWIIAK